ncbi:MAG: ABC transporter permease subunit [Alphaproteobacteria bacterium]|nr:ABC transporter permease subunit [Alphaproteobacteria bacterium]
MIAATRLSVFRRLARRWDTWAFHALNLLIVAFLLLPLVFIVLFAFNEAPYIQFPPRAFSLRWLENFLTSPDFMGALWISVKLALITVLVATVIGTMAAIALVRGNLPGAGLLNAFFLSPLMVPSILTGLAIFQMFYITDIGRNFWALVIGHVTVTVPYTIRTVTAVLKNFDRSLEEAAHNLGADRWTVFREVTLPLIRPGVIAGGMFGFIVSFDQFEVSLFLVRPDTTTLPIHLFNYLRFNFDPTIAAASLVSLTLSVVAVLLIERLVGLNAYLRI